MIGLAAVFHVISAIALLAIVFSLLRMKSQRDTLRRLVSDVPDSNRPKRVSVGIPGKLIGGVAVSLGIPVEGTPSSQAAGAIGKVDFQPLMDLFLHRGLSLLRWTSHNGHTGHSGHTGQGRGPLCGLDLVLTPGSSPMSAPEIAQRETQLKAAFGAEIEVRIVLS